MAYLTIWGLRSKRSKAHPFDKLRTGLGPVVEGTTRVKRPGDGPLSSKRQPYPEPGVFCDLVPNVVYSMWREIW